MHLPEGSRCFHCKELLKVGERIYVTWSDYFDRQAVFHETCWEYWRGFVDFKKAINKRSNPS